MEETKAAPQEEKPFSVLEKFRQLKKEKEQLPVALESKITQTTEGIPSTVFQTSSSSPSYSNGDIGRGGFRGRGFNKFGGQRKRRFENTNEKPSKRLAADHWRGQKESDVGITEFLRSGDGFNVILKHRYSDFHVNEIDLEGNVVKLTSIDIPKEAKVELSTEEDPNILSPEQWKTLGEIVEKKLSSTIEKDVSELSKVQRQRIHKALKMRFGVHVYSNTLDKDNQKVMTIGYGLSQITRVQWPDDRPEYLHFVLYKENCETSDALTVISRLSRLKVNKFGFAGTKDKRAVTTQQICVRRTEAIRFQRCTELRAVAIGNFCYKWHNLRLGDLKGNRFRMVLRNVKASDEVIGEAVECLKKEGFINYFGMQRFGQSALVPTHLVGQAILQGDWKLATELILKPRPGEATFSDVKEAREVWWETRDAEKALRCLGRKEKSIEGKIIFALRTHGPNAYQNAFDALPHHTVTLYLHAYQSLVWNQVVSRRLRQFGVKVLPGDLVSITEAPDTFVAQDGAEHGDDHSDEDDDAPVKTGCKIQVKVLSAEEAETASIYDVVYPLPGDDIRLPDNEISSWYHEFLEANGHSMDSFGQVNQKYGMYGTYRKMLETVEDLKWYTKRYSDPDEDLLQTDLDVYNKKPPLKINPDGPYKAMVVEFNLKSSCYATMAIRELAKCDTSTVSQAKLTRQAREEDLASRKQEEEVEKMATDSEVEEKKDICDMEQDSEDPRTNESNNHNEQQSNSDNFVEKNVKLER